MTDAALAWAITHTPTREAYRRSTGENIGPALDRYLAWLRENIIGPTAFSEDQGAVSSNLRASSTGTGVGDLRRVSSTIGHADEQPGTF